MKSVVICDTSVLINFLKVDRLDLLEKSSFQFFVTDHVRAEVKESNDEQLQRLLHGLQRKILKELKVTEQFELERFAQLCKKRNLGIGECSAIAAAVSRDYILGIDDKLAIKIARSLAPQLTILRTQDLVRNMVHEGVLGVDDAVALIRDWEVNHRFKLKSGAFDDLLTPQGR